jgi:Tfp pilus assembly protein PilV
MSPPHSPPAGGQAGFTIIETMVACVLLLVGLVATLTLVEQASSTTVKTRNREQATNLQRELVEAARSVSYDRLSPNGLGPAVRARPALGDSSIGAAGWTVQRRNATYTVAMGACTVDDPRDGTGAHEAGVFCAAGGPAPADANLDGAVDGLVSASTTSCSGTACDTNPADYKRIIALVRWPGGSNVQTSQVNNPGAAAAPAVTSLTAPTLTAPYIISDTRTSSLGLAATTTNTPSTVALYLDGTAIGTLSSTGGANWAGAWNLGPVTTTVGAQPPASETVDGSYELSAKAFDQYGQYGATRSQTVAVNRRQPFAPARVEAGRNGSRVEIEWSPAKERDSEGFRVDRRVNGGAWVEACARAVRTACSDGGAPAPSPGQTLAYSVVGYDRDPAGFDFDPVGPLRAGDRSEVASIADPAPAAPNTPSSLQASLVDGNVVLTWTSPAGTSTYNPGEANVPDHYNVYRDGQAYGDRLDSAYFSASQAGQSLSFTDSRTAGQLHDYWITAVNSQLGESPKLGPVRR